MVEYRGPPRMRITPKLLKQKMNTRREAAMIPGRRTGKVTFQKACQGEAPSTWAACDKPGWIRDQKPPTILKTTVKL